MGLKQGLTALLAGVCSAVSFAATSYIVPWYVNPSPQVRLYTGLARFSPVDLRIGADGKWLLANLQSEAGVRTMAWELEELASLSGVQTNRHNGCGDLAAVHVSSRVAVGSDRFLCVNTDDGTGLSLTPGTTRWAGRFAPTSVAFGTGFAASSCCMDGDGRSLWTDDTADPTKLVKWSFAGENCTNVGELSVCDAGHTAFAFYTVDDTQYAVVARTDGSIAFVNAATGAVKFSVTDEAHLAGGVAAVRMSHCDHFRPRLYVLFASGDIAAYYLNRELTKATWSKTIANATLLTAASAPFTADAAKITAFDVTPDGRTAALGYAPLSEETEADGVSYIALVKHEPKKWILYEPADAGNPVPGSRCLTDGDWHLSATWGTSGEVWIGNDTASVWDQRCWLDDNFHEYLDFSHGYCYKASGNEKHTLNGNYQYGLATNALGRAPRVLLHSPKMSAFDDRSKGWNGSGNYEEIVIDASTLTWMRSWSGPGMNSLAITYNFASLPTGHVWMIYPNNENYYGSESRWEDVTLTVMSKVLYRCFSHFDAKGRLTMPAVQVVSNEAFSVCRYMTEARLGEGKKSLTDLWYRAFSGCSSLRKLVLGGAEGFTIHHDNVFNGCPLEEVVFTGTKPLFGAGVSVAWPDTAEKTVTFVAPRGVADWETLLADTTLVHPLTEAEQRSYRQANPGKYIPFGVIDKSVLRTRYDQYVAWSDRKGGCRLTVERDTFFGEELEVSSDWSPDEDGTYMPGTVLTLTASPRANGIFRRWYGDVDPAAATNTSLTLTITNDVWLYCRVVHPWTLSSDRTTLSNGNFTLNCTVKNADARTLKLGKAAKSGLFADDDLGQGVCDLGGPIVQADDGTRWTIVEHVVGNGLCCGKRSGKGAAHTLIFSGTLTASPAGQWLHQSFGGDPYGRSYRTFIMDEPSITDNPFPSWSTCSNEKLTRFILQIPNVRGLTGNPSLWGVRMDETKFDWWDVSSLSSIGYQAFAYTDWTIYAPAHGTLTLPSYCNVTNAIRRMPNIEALSLGGRTKATTVTYIAGNAFTDDPKLRTLTVYNDRTLEVGGTVFSSAAYTPKEIVLTGVVTDNDVFANLLGKVTAAAAKPVKVYVSANMGWGNLPAFLDAPTAAERAEAPGERVLGVYRGDAAAPNGKALVLHRSSPFDPRGLHVHFR